jgi:thymidylate kinase
MILTFSGIDGAGKSTQIFELQFWLSRCGLRTKLVAFWDDIAALSRFREFASHKVFKGDPGIGSPDNPANRRDKNVTSWPLTIARFFFYFVDALRLRLKMHAVKKNSDVVIFDRYIFDELANLPLTNVRGRAFARLILKLVPKPEIAYLIDADPEAARARKPEYPLEFLHHNRQAYIHLAELAGDITIITATSVERTQAKIRQAILENLSARNTSRVELPVLHQL